jgi:hypothetical protein
MDLGRRGTFSGINTGIEGVYFDLGAKTSDQMLRFLRKYCNDHPLADFRDSATELAKSLPRLRRKDDTPAPR